MSLIRNEIPERSCLATYDANLPRRCPLPSMTICFWNIISNGSNLFNYKFFIIIFHFLYFFIHIPIYSHFQNLQQIYYKINRLFNFSKVFWIFFTLNINYLSFDELNYLNWVRVVWSDLKTFKFIEEILFILKSAFRE